ncbi:hypothetical protein A2335_03605 [Candidatus Peregrinibacteria bacterium RIFOXYB2_FULL_32_7]|nr:MAG: hypothetical protein A2335_03605 [Candidatus Peregrinibacteria bacterium RIFOXYB2_FULL_32_7]
MNSSRLLSPVIPVVATLAVGCAELLSSAKNDPQPPNDIFITYHDTRLALNGVIEPSFLEGKGLILIEPNQSAYLRGLNNGVILTEKTIGKGEGGKKPKNSGCWINRSVPELECSDDSATIIYSPNLTGSVIPDLSIPDLNFHAPICDTRFIVSGSFTQVKLNIQDALGIDSSFCTTLIVTPGSALELRRNQQEANILVQVHMLGDSEGKTNIRKGRRGIHLSPGSKELAIVNIIDFRSPEKIKTFIEEITEKIRKMFPKDDAEMQNI